MEYRDINKIAIDLKQWIHQQEVNNLSTALLTYSYPLNYNSIEKIRKEIDNNNVGDESIKYYLKDNEEEVLILHLVFSQSPVTMTADEATSNYSCKVVYHASQHRVPRKELSKWYEPFKTMYCINCSKNL